MNLPKLDKRPSFDRTIYIGQILQHEIDQLLVSLFAQPTDETLARELLPEPVRREAVFGEAEIKERRDGDLPGAELLLLLDQIGTADSANGTFMPQRREELLHCRGHGLWRKK